MNLDEFRGYLKIDKHALDDELISQPLLFNKVAEAHVMAVAKRDALKEKMAAVDANLDGQYREELERATEASVKAAIQNDSRHKQAFREFLEAKTEADLCAALKEAFTQRNYALRDLCQLQMSNYYENQSVKVNSESRYRAQRERLAAAR